MSVYDPVLFNQMWEKYLYLSKAKLYLIWSNVVLLIQLSESKKKKKKN